MLATMLLMSLSVTPAPLGNGASGSVMQGKYYLLSIQSSPTMASAKPEKSPRARVPRHEEIEAAQRENDQYLIDMKTKSEAIQAHILRTEQYLHDLQRSLGRTIIKEPIPEKYYVGPDRKKEEPTKESESPKK
jgi:hypothetical protein